jgi:hypothetical protein
MSDEKKIIIDEDWKSQVQAEMEALQREVEDSADTSSVAASAAKASGGEQPMPPASFEMLVTSLATEALMSMGQVPNPITGKTEANRGQAQYLIDMLDMLRQKTKGNLTPAEDDLIENVLHQLRMLFITVAASAPAGS